MADPSNFPRPAPLPPVAGERLTLLPDPRFTAAIPIIEERLEVTGRQVTGDNFASLLDSLMERMIADAFADARTHVGIILLLGDDARELTVAYQVGSVGADWRGRRIPAGQGRRGLVLASQQAFCGNHQQTDPLQDHSIEAEMGAVVSAEIIVPFYFARQLKGLVVALQMKPRPEAPDPDGFSREALEVIELLSTSLGRLLDYRLICSALGMEM
ncbi:MAG: GAF domain-containing protein [Verrucomicrobiales bacterium]